MKTIWQSTLVVAVGAGLLTMAALVQTQERTQERTNPRTAAGPKGPSDQIKVSNCYINMIESRTVASPRGGILAFVRPEEGDLVKVEEIVAKIKDEVAAAQFATADKQAKNDIEIRFGMKSAELAQWEHFQAIKTNQLLPGTTTEMELKKLKLAFERAELQTENAQKEHDVAASKRDEAGEILETHKIQTPISGMVTKVYKRTGEAVREGDPIIDVVNTDRMRVSGYVPFAEVSRIRAGDKVKVHLDIPNAETPEEEESFEGRITFVDLTVVKGSNPEVKVYAEVANRDNILRDNAGARMVLYPKKALAPANATTQREVPRRPVGNE